MSTALPPAIEALLAELGAAERGFVVGALAFGAAESAGLAATVEPPDVARRCERLLAAIVALPRAERVRVTGILARRVLALPPVDLTDAGVAKVAKVDRLRAALAGESSETIRWLAAAGPDVVRTAAAAVLLEKGPSAGPLHPPRDGAGELSSPAPTRLLEKGPSAGPLHPPRDGAGELSSPAPTRLAARENAGHPPAGTGADAWPAPPSDVLAELQRAVFAAIDAGEDRGGSDTATGAADPPRAKS